MSTVSELIADLLGAEPALDAALRAHIADNNELLPHVFMADVTRWLVANGPSRPVLDVLEQHLGHGDPEARDVIVASFLENLERADPIYRPVRTALGPTLRASLKDMENWSP